MTAADLANEITRLGAALSPSDSAAPPDTVLDLSLALAQQHNAGDLARAAGLLEMRPSGSSGAKAEGVLRLPESPWERCELCDAPMAAAPLAELELPRWLKAWAIEVEGCSTPGLCGHTGRGD